MWRCAGLIWLAGCSLYFDAPPSHSAPDAAAVPGDATSPADAEVSCPLPGTSLSVGYPADGATDVAQPVPIQIVLSRPPTDTDVFATHLSDATGQPVSLDHYDAACSTPISQVPTNPLVWTECYDELAAGSAYSWHVDVACYGSDAMMVELAYIDFTTSYGATTSSSP